MGGTNFNTDGQKARVALVLALIRREGATQDQVGALLRVARSSALPYLHYLRDDGLVHRREHSKLWVAGPSHDWMVADQLLPDAPVVRSVAATAARNSVWVRRDPLVEALFGPARPSEAANASAKVVRA